MNRLRRLSAKALLVCLVVVVSVVIVAQRRRAPRIQLADGAILDPDSFSRVTLRNLRDGRETTLADLAARPNGLVVVASLGDCGACFSELDLLLSSVSSCDKHARPSSVIITGVTASPRDALPKSWRGGDDHVYWDQQQAIRTALGLVTTPLKFRTDASGRIVAAEHGSAGPGVGIVRGFVDLECKKGGLG